MKIVFPFLLIMIGFNVFAQTKEWVKDTSNIQETKKIKDFPVLPMIGYNQHDGFMFGIVVKLPEASQPIKFHSYLLTSLDKNILGTGEISYQIKSDKPNAFFEPFIRFQRFSFFCNPEKDYTRQYNRISPGLTYKWKSATGDKNNILRLTTSLIYEDFTYFTGPDEFYIENLNSQLFRLGYYETKEAENYNTQFWTELDYYNYETPLQTSSNFLKLTGAYHYEWVYKKDANIGVRFWASYFIINGERKSTNYSDELTKGSAALIHQGENDYAYDELYFSRLPTDNYRVNQFSYHGGGFKSALPANNFVGMSNHLALSMNSFIELPIKSKRFAPILFFDLGAYSQFKNEKQALKYLYSGGIGFKLKKKNAGIYFPLINSEAINDVNRTFDYGLFKTISFNFSLNPFY